MSQSGTYEVGRDLGGEGEEYQRLLACFLLQRMIMNGESDGETQSKADPAESGIREFKLAFEMKDAGKFEDVCIYLKDEGWFLIQSKHTVDIEDKIITSSILFSDNDKDFSLIPYLRSFQEWKETFQQKHGEIKHIILFTDRHLESNFEENDCTPVNLDDSFKFSKGSSWKLKGQEDNLIEGLRYSDFKADNKKILNAMVNLFSDKNIELEVLKKHHYFLKKLIVCKNKKVSLNEPETDQKHPYIKKVYEELVKKLMEKYVKSKSIAEKKMGDFWTFKEDKGDRRMVTEFLSKLVLSVSQPNVEELKEEMINEGRCWMRGWLYPDDLGRMSREFFELPYKTMCDEFKKYEKNYVENAAEKKRHKNVKVSEKKEYF